MATPEGYKKLFYKLIVDRVKCMLMSGQIPCNAIQESHRTVDVSQLREFMDFDVWFERDFLPQHVTSCEVADLEPMKMYEHILMNTPPFFLCSSLYSSSSSSSLYQDFTDSDLPSISEGSQCTSESTHTSTIEYTPESTCTSSTDYSPEIILSCADDNVSEPSTSECSSTINELTFLMPRKLWNKASYNPEPSPAFITLAKMTPAIQPIIKAEIPTIAKEELKTPDPKPNQNYVQPIRSCNFCRQNKEEEEYCLTHALKDNRGNVVCPILRAYTCPTCGATGNKAHTYTHCPYNVNAATINKRTAKKNALGKIVPSPIKKM